MIDNFHTFSLLHSRDTLTSASIMYTTEDKFKQASKHVPVLVEHFQYLDNAQRARSIDIHLGHFAQTSWSLNCTENVAKPGLSVS